MMRHVYGFSGIDNFGKGLLSGLCIGLILVTPWIATLYGFGARPRKLLLIGGGYATFRCAIIGAVMTLLCKRSLEFKEGFCA